MPTQRVGESRMTAAGVRELTLSTQSCPPKRQIERAKPDFRLVDGQGPIFSFLVGAGRSLDYGMGWLDQVHESLPCL